MVSVMPAVTSSVTSITNTLSTDKVEDDTDFDEDDNEVDVDDFEIIDSDELNWKWVTQFKNNKTEINKYLLPSNYIKLQYFYDVALF